MKKWIHNNAVFILLWIVLLTGFFSISIHYSGSWGVFLILVVICMILLTFQNNTNEMIHNQQEQMQKDEMQIKTNEVLAS